MMALPSAESFAIKDAAQKLGKLFGKDLNRRETVAFAGAYSSTPPTPDAQQQSPKQNNEPTENFEL